MTKETYKWTDNPTVSGVSVCDTDVLNDCLMHLKYDKKDGTGGYNLFDIKITDHILTGDEAAGWLLQGSLVTMTYPDAVNKIKALYADAVETTFRGITCKQTIDGRYIADISQETEVDRLFVSTGVSDFYILDEANNQFYLPKTKAFMQFTNNPDEVNSFIEAGLPNIKSIDGGIGGRSGYSYGSNISPFYKISDLYLGNGTGGNNVPGPFWGFDASLANNIYGNSSTVQPPSSNKLLYYKVGNTIVNESTINLGNISTDLQSKADFNLLNVTNPSYSFKTMSVGWSMPDYSAGISVNANTPVTAQFNGYLVVEYWYSNAVFYVMVDGKKVSGGGSSGTVYQSNSITNTVPIKKDSVFKVVPNSTNMCTTSVFYPLLGGNND